MALARIEMVALRDSEKAAREPARQTGVTYPLAFDDTGPFYRALPGIGMPFTVLVIPDGMIASTRSGCSMRFSWKI